MLEIEAWEIEIPRRFILLGVACRQTESWRPPLEFSRTNAEHHDTAIQRENWKDLNPA